MTERAVAPRRVVERLDVIEDGKLGVAAASGNRGVEPGVGLQGGPKRFHGGVVVAVPGPSHAAFEAGSLERGDVVVDVLAATVRMVQEPFGRPAAFDGVAEGRQDQAGVDGGSARPADNLATPQIEDGAQTPIGVKPDLRVFYQQPAFAG